MGFEGMVFISRIPTREEFERTYLALYAEAQAVFVRHNPCAPGKDRKEGHFTCRDSRFGHACCSGCKHLGTEGCTVKSLNCKLWLCSVARKATPEASLALNDLYNRARAAGLPTDFYGVNFRTSLEEDAASYFAKGSEPP